MGFMLPGLLAQILASLERNRSPQVWGSSDLLLHGCHTRLPGGQLMLEPLEILSLSDLARDQLWGTATGGLAGDSLFWIKSYRP